MHKTKMEPNKVIDSDVYKYRSGEIALSEATRITNKKTGVTVKISPNAKAAYTVMRYRYSYFSSTGKKYYDNEDQIAAGSAISIDTVARVKKDLSAVGLIEIHSKQVADKRSNSYVVHNINPNDFLLERQDKKLGWVNCLDYPVFGNHEHLEPETTEEQETEAVTETSPQEPQQQAINPASPSDVVQNETEKTNEEDKLQSLFESYRSYCFINQLDEQAYESNFGDFYDETFRPELEETFKRFMPFLASYDFEEEIEF